MLIGSRNHDNGLAAAREIGAGAAAIELDVTDAASIAAAAGRIRAEGAESLEDGSREVVRVALLGAGAPGGAFTRWDGGTIAW